jgi:hypothetical protein
MYSLTHSDDMKSIGDASMDLEEIIEHLPSITSEDRDNAASILSNITFNEIPEDLQAEARAEIVNFLNGRSPTLAPIPEEESKKSKSAVAEPKVPILDFSTLGEKKIAGPKLSALAPTIARPSSSAEKKSASHNPSPIKEDKGTRSGTPFTNNFAKLLETIGNNKTK